jgi:hypothetical protein
VGLPSGLFPSGFPTKTLYTPLLSPIRATCQAYIIINRGYKSSSHGMIISSAVVTTTWKCSRVAAQIKVNCCYLKTKNTCIVNLFSGAVWNPVYFRQFTAETTEKLLLLNLQEGTKSKLVIR